MTITKLAIVALAAVALLPAQPSRIPAADNARRTALPGHIQPRIALSDDQGRVDPSLQLSNVSLTFAPGADQQTALDELLARQQKPGSPDYHRWLTPEQYAERFGLSAGDLGTVRAWLESQGLTVTNVARSRTSISVSGAASQFENAFQTELHRYLEDGQTHIANATAPTVPERFAGVVRAVRGLNDFRPRPFKHVLRGHGGGVVKPSYTSSTGKHYLAPDDLATIYNIAPLYRAGISGAGQRVVIAGQTRIQLSDIQQFRSEYGLPAMDPELVLVPGARDPGISADDIDEAHLDIEWSGAVARNANIVYVYAWDVFDAVQYAIDQNLAPVISTSYGLCELALSSSEAAAIRVWAQQANAQGITWFSASGDTGAADCSYLNNSSLAVDFPASIPEITAVGGAEFQEGAGTYWGATNSSAFGSALSYIPEIAWNDSATDGEPSATGGGVSRFWAKPSWQTGPGVPGANARHVPDVSMSASADHDGYLVYSQGDDWVFGGTSVPTPVYAGVAALLNQHLGTAGLGNINPNLYQLAQSTTGIFHDITSGDNIVTVTCPTRARNCTTATVGYSAGAGYDLATGLGSVDVWQLVSRWNGGSAPASDAGVSLTLESSLSLLAATDTVFLTATATSTDGSTPAGTVTFAQGATTLGTADLAGAGGVATATLAITGARLAQGAVTASLTGAPTASVTLTVGASAATAAPSIASVLNAASFQAAIARGAIVSVFGSQLAATTDVAATLPLARAISGVAATVNGIAAPLWYVSPGQINLQIPYQTPAGAPTLVINNNGRTTSYTMNVSAAAPGIFTTVHTAARGDAITLYLTGAGAVSPAIANGAAPTTTPLPAPEQTVAVTIGGVPASTTFVGEPTGVVGVVQINLVVPSSVAAGSQPVVVTVGGAASAPVTLTITP